MISTCYRLHVHYLQLMSLSITELLNRTYISFQELFESKTSIETIFTEKKHSIALVYIGQWYEYGIHRSRSHELAAQYYKEASDKKVPWGQVLFGMCHELGWGGIEQDYKMAIRLYKRSKHPLGTFRLGRMYEKNKGFKYNKWKAVSLYQEAAQENNPHAMVQCVFFLRQMNMGALDKDTFKYLEKASNLGYEVAQFELAREIEEVSTAIDLLLKSTQYIRMNKSLDMLKTLTHAMTADQMKKYIKIFNGPVQDEYLQVISAFVPDNYECPICLEPLNIDMNLLVTKCFHCFHQTCMMNITKCPLCRRTPVEKL